jgi:hypothetical protein
MIKLRLFLKEMSELTIIGMECDEDVIMQSGDGIDNAIVVSDDEDVTGGVIKMETAEPRVIKSESSKCEEDDKPEIEKGKQSIDGDTCEHEKESESNIDIKVEKIELQSKVLHGLGNIIVVVQIDARLPGFSTEIIAAIATYQLFSRFTMFMGRPSFTIYRAD